MFYAIGDVARILGLTTAALHYFEKEEVILSLQKQGNRRLYEPKDIMRLISSRKYRSMELPLKEIAKQFSDQGNTLSEIRQKLSDQQTQLQEEIKRCQKLYEDIDWFHKAIERSLTCYDQVTIEWSPACYGLSVGKDGIASHHKKEQDALAQWIDALPASKLSIFSFSESKATFGLCMEELRCIELGLDQIEGVVYKPSTPSLHGFVSIPFEQYEEPEEALPFLYQYAKEHHYEVNGDGMGIHLAVDCHNGTKDTMIEMWLPIDTKIVRK